MNASSFFGRFPLRKYFEKKRIYISEVVYIFNLSLQDVDLRGNFLSRGVAIGLK